MKVDNILNFYDYLANKTQYHIGDSISKIVEEELHVMLDLGFKPHSVVIFNEEQPLSEVVQYIEDTVTFGKISVKVDDFGKWMGVGRNFIILAFIEKEEDSILFSFFKSQDS